jgi:hypothetical protein
MRFHLKTHNPGLSHDSAAVNRAMQPLGSARHAATELGYALVASKAPPTSYTIHPRATGSSKLVEPVKRAMF